jgi:hypothetical protein
MTGQELGIRTSVSVIDCPFYRLDTDSQTAARRERRLRERRLPA